MHDPEMPSPAFLVQLLDYVQWADLKQLESTRNLSDVEYHKDRGWSFGSIHRVMLHMLSAQSIWLDRFEGAQPVWLFDDPQMAAREAIELQWPITHGRCRTFFQTQTPHSLSQPVAGDRFHRPLGPLMFHLCNHAMHHRGQLNSMIQLAGGTPVEVDYSIWVREQ